MAYPSSDKDDRASNVLADSRYIGTARADISCLTFSQGRQTDHQIVEELITVFGQKRCRRYEPGNYIPVLISKANLKRALKASKLKRAALQSPAEDGSLCFLRTAKKQKLFCFHGRHRIEAAKRFLPDKDQWWTIRVYLVESDGTQTIILVPGRN
jgi:hypothetical protein